MPTHGSLIGREEDLAALGRAFERARSGDPRTVVLSGDAGIGKTRLVEEFAGRAFAAGARVLTGACVDVGDAALPYAGILDALRAAPPDVVDGLSPRVRRALGTLLPEAAPDDEPAEGGQSGLFGAVVRLVEELGRAAPVVLVVEDLHQADRSTQTLLRFLVRALRDTAVLLVVTYRTDELEREHPAHRLVADLGRDPRVELRRLRPLTRSETAGQLAALAGRPVAGETIDAVHARSDGNPFYSAELLAAAADGGAVPDSLRDTLLARIDRLPSAARGVVRVAAACGRDVDHDLLAAGGTLDDDALDEAVRACVLGHVLVVDDGGRGYRFRHALLQEVAAGELLPGERRRLHARLADALDARPPRPGTAAAQTLAEIAFHRLRSDDAPPALAAAVRAARAAEAVHAMPEASRNYDAALALWDHVAEPAAVAAIDLPSLLERAADCRWLGFGDTEIRADLHRRAIAELRDGASRLRRADHLSRMAATSCAANVTAALSLHEEAVALLDDAPSEVAAEVRTRYAVALMLVDRNTDAEREALAAEAVARAVGATVDEAHSVITRAVCRSEEGDADRAIALLERARPVATESGDLRLLQRYYVNGTHILSRWARHEDAVRLAREGIAAHTRAGLAHEGAALVQENGASALCALGRPTEAAALIDEPPAHATAASACLRVAHARVALLLGDPDAAADHLAIAAGVERLESLVLVPLRALQAETALWRDDLPTALVAVQAGEEAFAESAADAAPLLAVALRAQADGMRGGKLEADAARSEADRLLARLADVASGDAGRLPEVAQRLRDGVAERARLAPDSDPAPWRAALAGWQDLRRPYEAAYAGLRLAEALAAGRSDRDELERVLRDAHDAAAGVGARHVTAELERLARRARVALGGATADDERFPDLTPREREVLTLVADGRTNRQIAEALFITEKTASVHVSNILAKLGAANRGEAAARAHRAGFAVSA